MTALWPFFSLGLLGAVHCAGMCGGFALALSLRPERRRALVLRQLGLVTGKALTYAVLGGLAAAAGGAAGAGGFEGLRVACAWFAGVTLTLFGAALCGLHLPGPRLGSGRLAAGLGVTWRRVAAAGGATGPIAAGTLIGLLPCGLSWSAVALAATQPVPVAVGGMLVFGFATAPALLLVSLGWNGLDSTRRDRLRWVAGPLLILFGLFTVARGLPMAQPLRPECCDQEASRWDESGVEGTTEPACPCPDEHRATAPRVSSPLPL